jgi:hypothetical protein
VTDALFRFVCVPAAFGGTPPGWAAEMLIDGELAVLADDGGLAAVDAVAHAVGSPTITIVRSEATPEDQEKTVIEFAGPLPLVWVARRFSEESREWARRRGPMTLLIEADGPLPDDDRHRIERFVAMLGRQAE